MPYIGAPICVTILQIVILGGIVVANPNLVPFIAFSCRSVFFWIVVGITFYVYLKAAWTNPGYLIRCPSAIIAVLRDEGVLRILSNSEVKFKGKKLSSTDKKKKRQTHNNDELNGCLDSTSDIPSDRTESLSYFDHLNSSQYNSHKKNKGSKKSQANHFSNRHRNKILLDRTLRQECNVNNWHMEQSKKYQLITNRSLSFSDKSETCSNPSWSDYDSVHDKNKEFIVDFSKNTDDNDEFSSYTNSLSELNDIETNKNSFSSSETSVEKHILAPIERHIHNSTDKLFPPFLEKEKVLLDQKDIELHSDKSISHSIINMNVNRTQAPNLKLNRDNNIIVTSPSLMPCRDISFLETGCCEELYPQALSIKHLTNAWKQTPSIMRHKRFSHTRVDAENEELVENRTPFFLLKKSLGQVGVPINSNATASATVGTVLTFASGTAAAVPVVAVTAVASQIAQKAREAWGDNNTVTRACVSLGRSAKQLKKEKYEEESSYSKTSLPNNLVDFKKKVSEVLDTYDIINIASLRSRNGNHFSESRKNSVSEGIELIAPIQSVDISRLRSFNTNNLLSPVKTPILEDVQPGKVPTVVSIDKQIIQITTPTDNKNNNKYTSCINSSTPNIFLYKHVFSETKEGLPCQNRIKLRLCRLCEKYQPLRTKHCVDCGKCVRTLDHHCPWLGSCVGEGNRVWFFWFLVCQGVELIWAMIETALAFIVMRSKSLDETAIGMLLFLNVYLIVAFIVMLFLTIMVLCLIGYHIFLAMSNITTWENIAWNNITYLKELPEEKGSPFSKGCRVNLYVYCCPPNFFQKMRQFFMPHNTFHYGPDNEVIWEHGLQKHINCFQEICN